MSGALLGAQKGFDLVASFLLVALVGLGGGVVREVLIGESPPAAFQRPEYFIPVVLAPRAADSLNELTAALASAVAVLFRVLALLYGWRIPLAYHQLRSDG